MRIDVHAHYWTEDYLDLLVDLGKADAGAARGLGAGSGAELDARLRLMDRARVEMQVLSACPQLPYGEDGKKAARAARFVNDQYAELIQAHPDRFRAFAALPMPHLKESLGEMRRALDELRMAGIAMNTTVLGHALVEPGYEPVFAQLNSSGAVLYLHPAGNSACSPLIRDYHLTWMVGAPVEDGRVHDHPGHTQLVERPTHLGDRLVDVRHRRGGERTKAIGMLRDQRGILVVDEPGCGHGLLPVLTMRELRRRREHLHAHPRSVHEPQPGVELVAAAGAHAALGVGVGPAQVDQQVQIVVGPVVRMHIDPHQVSSPRALG